MKERPMLEYALHPVEDRLVHVDEFCCDLPLLRGLARCPLCSGVLRVVQLRDRTHARRFVHAAGPFARCPLVSDAVPNPLAVDVGPPLTERARQLRASFFAQWQRHLQTIRQTASAFNVTRFTGAIEHADVLKMWGWPTLAQRDIPYVMLVLTDFIAAPANEKQAAWLRFRFDASVQQIGDLGKPDRVMPRLFRLRYKRPRMSKYPSVRHLIDCQQVPMTAHDMVDAEALLTGADVSAFESFAQKMARTPAE
ncbi:hypothetical protein [Burkholderia gladioli]|uniref:hypothetical protein n=1 Tax=Burkholderia gladioli TaxID=28095 RepID=UPI001FC8E8B4|nr:hypothetical protein [Burkholderia gladioli]